MNDEMKPVVLKKKARSKILHKEDFFGEEGYPADQKLATAITHITYDLLLKAWDSAWERGDSRCTPIYAELFTYATEEKLQLEVELTMQVKKGKRDGEIDGDPREHWAEERLWTGCECSTNGVPCSERLESFGGGGHFSDYYNLPFPVVVRF